MHVIHGAMAFGMFEYFFFLKTKKKNGVCLKMCEWVSFFFPRVTRRIKIYFNLIQTSKHAMNVFWTKQKYQSHVSAFRFYSVMLKMGKFNNHFHRGFFFFLFAISVVVIILKKKIISRNGKLYKVEEKLRHFLHSFVIWT